MSVQIQELTLLAGLLAEPCEESLSVLQEVADQLPWLSAEALEQLRQTPLEQWQAEHTGLFVSGHPKTPCMPFESVWLEGQMMGEAMMAVSQLYQATGFKANPDLPADFLGTQLKFLAHLIEYHRENEKLMHEVLLNMSAWIPKFATSVRIHAHLKLYKDWANRLEALFNL
ncbi:molecular chaperone TorD family protein [Thiomicrospira sp. R3]|uniref:TorD/DmsD family molecular chaperone n=1 Tax=Thiomicrospira sp. R3 TaxID=3035472 RepID=UPI00259B36DC|nr:molecular chaperone TorD family protein [Thiomicrospira sp. R3]WFE69561.1 molecular chaperone TorD family protein [Thiomicrospira sp. R3]